MAVTFWQTSSTESGHSHLYPRHQATLRMARTEHSNHWDTSPFICEPSTIYSLSRHGLSKRNDMGVFKPGCFSFPIVINLSSILLTHSGHNIFSFRSGYGKVSVTQAWPAQNCRWTQPFVSAIDHIPPNTRGSQQEVYSRSRNGAWIHSIMSNSSCSNSCPCCQNGFLSWNYHFNSIGHFLSHSSYNFSNSLLSWPPSCISLNLTAMWPSVEFQEYS